MITFNATIQHIIHLTYSPITFLRPYQFKIKNEIQAPIIANIDVDAPAAIDADQGVTHAEKILPPIPPIMKIATVANIPYDLSIKLIQLNMATELKNMCMKFQCKNIAEINL
mmetsp:Transcript_5217/g.475  ORF Transcript_5217/g.475 Transcript_5217/m.475 type:complete len:112 (+) Transcript_5217:323-658(+)